MSILSIYHDAHEAAAAAGAPDPAACADRYLQGYELGLRLLSEDYVPPCREHRVEDCSHVDCQIAYAREGY